MISKEQVTPNLAESYRRSVVQLGAALRGDAIEQEQARQALRALIDQIVASPAPDKRGVALEIRGRFAQMIDLANEKATREGRLIVCRRWLRGQDLNL